MISCANVTDADTSYCCDHMPNCCNSGVGRFNVLPPEPDIWARWNRDSEEYSVVGTMFEDTATTTSSQPRPTTSRAPATTTNESQTTASQIPEPKESIDDPNEEEESLSTGAMAGIGVGAAIGVLLVVAVSFLLWKLRRQKKAQSSHVHTDIQQHNQQPYFSTNSTKNVLHEQESYTHDTGRWGYGASELPARSVTRQSRPYELDGGM